MYSLLYVHAWDHDLDEAVSGHCITECPDLDRAIAVASNYAAIAHLEWCEPGWIAITDHDHHLVASVPCTHPHGMIAVTASA